MFLFSKDYFFESLKNLTVTEEQIKTLGMYIKTFKKEHKNILEVWTYVYSVSSIHHKLVLLYLVNEILQTDKNYDTESLALKNGFREFISANYGIAKAKAKKYPPLYKKFCDLERVWNERHVIVFNTNFNMEEFFVEIDNCGGNEQSIIDVMTKYMDILKRSQLSK